MPIYEFRNLKTGKVEQHFLSVERRDCVAPHLKRLFTPTRGFLAGAIEERSPDGAIPKSLRQIEERGANWRSIERDTGFSRDSLRRIWNF